MSGRRDSDSRPRPWQGRALPTELLPRGAANIKAVFNYHKAIKNFLNDFELRLRPSKNF